jgi:Ser-tRNA(Ala) deacylase AlaX
MSAIIPTKLRYLEDFTLLEDEARVADVVKESDRDVILLDGTIFYPQGGGQPYDKGVVESPSGKFTVKEVRFAEGAVKHIGKFESGSFAKGEIVIYFVDKERRSLHNRLHSAGHVVDMAVNALKLNWIPGKGCHFPEGPYVEYAGSLEGLEREKLKTDIENACNKFVKEGRETRVAFMDKDKMHKVCHFVPDYIPEGKPGRVVMFGDFGVPCGGTHVANLTEVGSMTVRKIKSEGENIRVGYDVER